MTVSVMIQHHVSQLQTHLHRTLPILAVVLSKNIKWKRLQCLDGDLIGATAGAMAALRRAPAVVDAPWLQYALLTLDTFTFVPMLLDAARSLPGIDASVADAVWKRCREVQLPQNLIKVRPKPSESLWLGPTTTHMVLRSRDQGPDKGLGLDGVSMSASVRKHSVHTSGTDR